MTQPPQRPGGHPGGPQWGPPRHEPQRAARREPRWQQPNGAHVRPRRGSGGLVIGLVIAGVFLLGFTAVGVGAIALSSQGARTRDPAQAPVVVAGPTSTPPTSTEPATTGEPTGTSPPPSTAEPLTGDPYAQPVLTLADNPINIPGNGAVNTPCALPPFATDLAAQDAFYQAAVPCLMRMWAPALREAGLPVRMPRVVTTGQDFDSPCGARTWDQTAMFCPGDNTIYMTARYYAEKENRTEGGVYLGQFAHEFGHAVQAMAGINQAYTGAVAAAGGSSPAGLELTRRSELQATCYEGMALAALQNGGVSNALIFPALADSRARGDEYNPQPDHGTVATNTEWIDRGFSTNRVVSCNTWAAPPSEVD